MKLTIKLSPVSERNLKLSFTTANEEDFDDCEPVTSVVGSKYMDRLGRLTLSVHVFVLFHNSS